MPVLLIQKVVKVFLVVITFFSNLRKKGFI